MSFLNYDNIFDVIILNYDVLWPKNLRCDIA